MTDSKSKDLTLYWRPGCPFCVQLRRDLRRAGILFREVNIWEDREGREAVRSVANGYETVPTVVVADKTFVNPAAGEIVDFVRTQAPQLLSCHGLNMKKAKRDQVLAAFQWMVVALLVVASFAAEGAGHVGTSWALDGVNLVIFWFIRGVRHRLS